jgi:hypothetical protein
MKTAHDVQPVSTKMLPLHKAVLTKTMGSGSFGEHAAHELHDCQELCVVGASRSSIRSPELPDNPVQTRYNRNSRGPGRVSISLHDMTPWDDWWEEVSTWSDARLAYEAGSGTGGEPSIRARIPAYINLRLIHSLNELRLETDRSSTTLRRLTIWLVAFTGVLVFLTVVLVVMTWLLLARGG